MANKDRMKLIEIPDDPMQLIAGFASPRDVYSLCLTSKRFFLPVSKDSSSTKESPRRGEQDLPLLTATKLLRCSLLSSLDHVLRHSAAGISLDQLNQLPFQSLPRQSVIFTGSIMAQCVLGEVWPGKDIDIFCMPDAAPTVRSWLIKASSQLYTGANDHYIGVENLGRTFLTNKIHHVEYYSNRPVDGAPMYHRGVTAFSFDQACRWGEEIIGNSFPTPWQRILYIGNDLTNPKYHIKPLPGDPFPCDFRHFDFRPNGTIKKLPHAFDLVVAKDECSNARELLSDFDLSICKVSWDGTKFSIPDPHFALRGRSTIEPERKALMDAYRRHYVVGYDLSYDESERRGRLALAAWPTMDEEERLQRIRKALALVYGDECIVSMDEAENAALNDNEIYEKLLRLDASHFALHNCIFKLFDRLAKYQERGVQVVGAPDTEVFTFRRFYDRDKRVVRVVGPPGTEAFSIRGFDGLDMDEDLQCLLEGDPLRRPQYCPGRMRRAGIID